MSLRPPLSLIGRLLRRSPPPAGEPPTQDAASWFGTSAAWDDLPAAPEGGTESEPPAPGASLPPFVRIYRVFIGARMALALVLLSAQLLSYALGNQPIWAALILSLVYAAQTLSIWLLPAPSEAQPRAGAKGTATPLRRRSWLATIGVDVVTLSLFYAMSPASGVNYPLLLALPVLMAGVMTPRLPALGVAAIVTLVLLGVALWGGDRSGQTSTLLTQAGLLGTGFFAIAVLAGELAERLASAGLSARGSMELARQQAQLNRLVIDEMQDGVLVVDRQGRVRAANPSARRLLVAEGMARAAPFQLRGVADWEPLVRSVEQAFIDGRWPAGGREVTLPLRAAQDSIGLRELRLRVRFTQRRDAQGPEDLCVLFVEDMRSIYARARQDKLAAMGRMSAGIAHEIRNPLAAIAQANALLDEDVSTPTQRKLTQMVSANVDRLKRIVDDVLDAAPGVRSDPGLIAVGQQVSIICEDWLRAAEIPAELRRTGAGGALMSTTGSAAARLAGRFDAEHLRRVLVNLLDNAWRHSSQTAGAIEVRLESRHRRGQGRDPREYLVLSVFNDGDVIPEHVERSLFEPFFSTRSRGAGLGLYICRELCERYGANIEYRQHGAQERRRNEFVVAMPAFPLLTAP